MITFARLPLSVLSDPTLSPADVRVYAAMASTLVAGNIVRASHADIAKIAIMKRQTVASALERLAKAGHVAKSIHKLKRKALYELKSPVFLSPKEADRYEQTEPSNLVSFPSKTRNRNVRS